jgi:hypothetical protein
MSHESYRLDNHLLAAAAKSGWSKDDFWKWTGLGTLIGGVAVGTWAELEVGDTRNDDWYIPRPYIIGAAAAVGGLAGAIFGALGYVSHLEQPAPPPPGGSP